MSKADTMPDDVMPDIVTPPPRNRWLRAALRMADTIKVGTLTVVLPDGSRHRVSASAVPVATIVLKHPGAVRRLVLRGGLGLADAYGDGLWDSPDLPGVMAIAAANAAEWRTLLRGRAWRRGLSRLVRAARPATRGGAGGGIVGQHGLGAAFYTGWLDPSMTCSAACFAGGEDELEAAQQHKIHRMCQMLRLSSGMRLLEIGCGWGSFAEVAARDYGVSVVGLTLSPAQLEYARARIRRAGLASRVELRLQDYRDVTGSFDRIVSIEMLETLGEALWQDYFDTLRERLRKNGVAGLQVATIAERLFEAYRRDVDVVRRDILPGGLLPSKARMKKAIGRAGLAWGEEYWFGRDYAQTLAQWRAGFQAAWPRIAATTAPNRRPCDERFRRRWDYGLAYCEAGFRAGWVDVGQILIARNG